MPKKSSTISGYYQDQGVIQLENRPESDTIRLTSAALPAIPYGTRVKITLTYEDIDYFHGTDGIVWATYHLSQAETIRGALQAQRIGCKVIERPLDGKRLYLLQIPEASEVPAAADFIWRDPGGLHLQPDWWYPAGAENESFSKWIRGV